MVAGGAQGIRVAPVMELGTGPLVVGGRSGGLSGCRTGGWLGRRRAMEELGRRVARWVDAGVIGREQGDAILAFERGGRRAVAVEVLGYLGGGLAVVAGFVLGAESWGQLRHWGRAGVLAVVTGVLLGAGWWLRGDQGRGVPPPARGVWVGAGGGGSGGPA